MVHSFNYYNFVLCQICHSKTEKRSYDDGDGWWPFNNQFKCVHISNIIYSIRSTSSNNGIWDF